MNKVIEIKMWKICTEKYIKNEFKCTEKCIQYNRGFGVGVKSVENK